MFGEWIQRRYSANSPDKLAHRGFVHPTHELYMVYKQIYRGWTGLDWRITNSKHVRGLKVQKL